MSFIVGSRHLLAPVRKARTVSARFAGERTFTPAADRAGRSEMRTKAEKRIGRDPRDRLRPWLRGWSGRTTRSRRTSRIGEGPAPAAHQLRTRHAGRDRKAAALRLSGVSPIPPSRRAARGEAAAPAGKLHRRILLPGCGRNAAGFTGLEARSHRLNRLGQLICQPTCKASAHDRAPTANMSGRVP